MKKLFFLTVVAIFVSIGANAQNFNKGDWMLNANVSGLNLSHAFTDNLNVTLLNIAANAGYFISDKFAVDATLGLDYLKIKGSDGLSDLTLGAGVRYYPVGNLFARVGYNGATSDNSSLVSSLGASVGYDWFVSERVFFEPTVHYHKQLAKVGSNNLGLGLGIGVRF